MALVVVPVAPEDAGLVTLDEWDRLCAAHVVLFERPDHPLAARVRDAGVAVAAAGDGPDSGADGVALVADPGSERIAALARAGAEVTAGPAGSDPLSSAHGADQVRRASSALTELVMVMARLRGPDGCPWDAQQTHESLRPHLLEEAYEVLDAIDSGASSDLAEELGDLLLQIVFHAQLAWDERSFDIAAVARGLTAKLINRHPHVFGDVDVDGPEDVVRNWEAIKASEKRRTSPLRDLPPTLPALMLAAKAQQRAPGFEVDAGDARSRAVACLRTGDVAGALFWTVAVARADGVDPESALRSATIAFVRTHATEEER